MSATAGTGSATTQRCRRTVTTQRVITGTARLSLWARPAPRAHSWGHARVEWPSGVSKDGWLRLGDAMDVTVDVTVEIATRLARGEGRAGAATRGALFGPELALAAGGVFVDA